MHRSILIAFVISLLAIGCAAAPVTTAAKPLRILLTNDDGYDAPGINTLQRHLLAAGHDVTLVAPLKDHSGSGIRVTTHGRLHYENHAAAVWSVDGTPADAVLVGLQHIMDGELPDLVVSGANFGPNLGYAGSSGTVGSARMATFAGIPAIAISVGVNPAEYRAEPYPFPGTLDAFTGAADFIVALINDLQAASSGGDRLLPQLTILSINYPAASPEQISGVRVVKSTWDAGVRIDYEETGEAGELRVDLQLLDPGTAVSNDEDWQLLARKYITISVFDGDPNSPDAVREAITKQLSTLDFALFSTPAANEPVIDEPRTR